MFSFPAPSSESQAESHEALAALEQLDFHSSGRSRSTSLLSPALDGAGDGGGEAAADLRDLTQHAVWVVSTAKPGNGVEQILDGNAETYWQSDGPQPHTISAHFDSKLALSHVEIFLNFDKDESYTPELVSVRAGSNYHDLRLVRKLGKLRNPGGWVRIPLGDATDGTGDEASDDDSELDGAGDDGAGDDASARYARREARQRARREKREKSADAAQRRAEQGANGRLEMLRDRSVTKAHMIQIVIHCNHQNGRDSHVRMVRVLGPKKQVPASSSNFTSRTFQMYESIR